MINAKLKRALAVSLVSAMAVSSLAACSSSSSSSAAGTTTTAKSDDATTTAKAEETTTVKADETTTAPAADDTTTAPEADDTTAPVVDEPFTPALSVPDTSSWDESSKIYAYSWNDEFGSRLGYVIKKYPELDNFVEYVNLGCSGTNGEYQEKIDLLLENADQADKYPSLIAMDNDVAKYYLETENTLPLSSVGITNEMYANAYPYTVQYATYNGELKGLTWQAAPGNVAYRYSIAEEVLGSGEPEDVQEALKDWDAFGETADKMKEAGYKMVSGPDEVKYAMYDQQTQPWIQDDTLTLDESVTAYLSMAKTLYEGEYTTNNGMWSEGWTAKMSGDKEVFCYFGCTWWLYWCLVTGDEGAEGSSYGDWRVCEGPVSYHWGGTYVGITKDCPNTELAAFLVYSLCCDEDILYTIEDETKDFVNNQKVTDKVIANGVGIPGMLNGQNPIPTWKEAALKINLENASYLDSAIKTILDKASEGLNAGTYADVDEAIQYVKDQVADQYSYITVE